MLSYGPALAKAVAVIPIAVLALFTGLLWLLALPCGKQRQTYVTTISAQAMHAIEALFTSPDAATWPSVEANRLPQLHQDDDHPLS